MKTIFLSLSFILIMKMNLLSQIVVGFCPPDTINKMSQRASIDVAVDLAVLPPPVSPPPYFNPADSFRMVYWVHGMNGSSGSWTRAATASSSHLLLGDIPGFEPRKIFSYQPDYSNAQVDLNAAAQALDPQLIKDSRLPSNYPDSASFVIAHSQGGIVTRTLLRLNELNHLEPKFGGFATFGTIHRGAVGLTGNNRTLSYKFFERAALDLAEGYLTEYDLNFYRPIDKFNKGYIAYLFNISVNIPHKDSIKSFIRKQFASNPITDQNGLLLSLLRSKIESGIATELQVGSASLNTLNSYDPKVKGAVAFYGVKNTYVREYPDGRTPLKVEPVWSLFNYFIFDPNASEYFQANQDWMFAERVRNAQLDYLETMNQNDIVRSILEGISCWPDFNCKCPPPMMDIWSKFDVSKNFNDKICKKVNRRKKARQLGEIIDAYRVGYMWFDRANNLWETAMGARGQEITSYTVCKIPIRNKVTGQLSEFKYVPLPNIPCGTNQQDNLMPFPDWNVWETAGLWTSSTEYITKIYYKENDGVVLAESARDLPFRTHDMLLPDGTDVSKMNDSSHMQMRNDENLKVALNHLFNGHVGDFFYTKPITP